MAFNLTDCPFCTATFETAQERDRQAGKHGSSRQVVDMALNGIRISVDLVDGTNGIYACPGICSTRGPLGVIFLHVMQEHPTNFANLKRMRDETDLPLDLRIMPPLSSSLEGQATVVDCHGSGICRYIPPNATIIPDLPPFATITLPTAPTLATLYHSTPPTFTYNAASAIEQHPDTGTNQSNQNHWEDWFRVLPYLVFRVKALRELIFAELGIDETVFDNDIVVYAVWVTFSVGGDVNDDRITNLIVLCATYLHLRMSGRLSLPPGGFKLDDSVPVLN
ncbi:hypothetical protein BT96DRAFT_981372 [Gymnopus androsaceus JB14]|uniref:Uncharacterized protein n=1 Tax=Gymnopus androsaceus JB14 TaxID=1447944 RepID=A0A6A4GPT3_9AGAR|nr:hypothetical protein BT96DRAFT_981372 [Gymnopus androsaceus JB14]